MRTSRKQWTKANRQAKLFRNRILPAPKTYWWTKVWATSVSTVPNLANRKRTLWIWQIDSIRSLLWRWIRIKKAVERCLNIRSLHWPRLKSLNRRLCQVQKRIGRLCRCLVQRCSEWQKERTKINSHTTPCSNLWTKKQPTNAEWARVYVDLNHLHTAYS